MPKPPAIRLVPDLYGAEPDGVVELLRELDDDVPAAIVIGHNPTAEALAIGLIDPTDKKGLALATRRGFPTCALGVYQFEIESWPEIVAHSAILKGLWIPPFGGS